MLRLMLVLVVALSAAGCGGKLTAPRNDVPDARTEPPAPTCSMPGVGCMP